MGSLGRGPCAHRSHHQTECYEALTSLNVLVIASSFPSVNQPWIDSHVRQLLDRTVDVSIVSFKVEVTPLERRASLDLMGRALFLTRNPRVFLRSWLGKAMRRPWTCVPVLFRNLSVAIQLNLTLRERLRIALFGAYLDDCLRGQKQPDLIHVHFDEDALLLLAFAGHKRVPIVTTFHGLTPVGIAKPDRNTRAVTYSAVDRVLVGTNFAKRQAIGLGCDEAKITMLPQGLPLRSFEFTKKSPPEAGYALRIMSVGRLHRDKGHFYALLAAYRLHRAGMKFEWIFVGAGPDREKLSRAVSRLGLVDSIRLVGEVARTDLAALYRDAHLFVLASVSNRHGHAIETQGVVLQEAQASGCIVIATRVGGIPECVNDQVDGILVRERSSRAIAAAIASLVGAPEKWAGLQSAGLLNVRDRFSSEVLGARTVDVYKDVINRSQGAPSAKFS